MFPDPYEYITVNNEAMGSYEEALTSFQMYRSTNVYATMRSLAGVVWTTVEGDLNTPRPFMVRFESRLPDGSESVIIQSYPMWKLEEAIEFAFDVVSSQFTDRYLGAVVVDLSSNTEKHRVYKLLRNYFIEGTVIDPPVEVSRYEIGEAVYLGPILTPTMCHIDSVLPNLSYLVNLSDNRKVIAHHSILRKE